MSTENPYKLPRLLRRGDTELVAHTPIDYQNWLVEGWRDCGPLSVPIDETTLEISPTATEPETLIESDPEPEPDAAPKPRSSRTRA